MSPSTSEEDCRATVLPQITPDTFAQLMAELTPLAAALGRRVQAPAALRSR